MSFYIGLSVLSNNGERRQDQALAFWHRGAGPRSLRAEARQILSGLEGRFIGEDDFAREEQGRPFFPGSGTDFSISHSGSLAAVSLTRGKGRKTGCDIQIMRPRKSAREIAESFFRAPERDFIFPRGRFSEPRFYAIWTLKECFLKLRGRSVFDMSGVPSFVRERGTGWEHLAFGASIPLSFYLYELDGGSGNRYMLAAALEGSRREPPELRWFSQSSLSRKSIAAINAEPNPADTVSPKI